MKRTIFLVLCGFFLSNNIGQAQWEPQASGTTADLRGLSVVSAEVAWASGSKGTFAHTKNGGLTWEVGNVPEAAEFDFRDVHAVDANTAYLLSAGQAEQGRARIYSTTDGGKQWRLRYANSTPGVFFDAFAFWDADHGIALSDPVAGHFLIITTSDGGATWKEVSRENISPALTGEAAFAASGTCLVVQGKSNVWFGTGGALQSRVFRSTDRGRTWTVATTPVAAGNSSSGIFSIAFQDAQHGIVVGGDYRKPDEAKDNVAITADGGKTWRLINRSLPGGFRSCVAYIPGTGGSSLVTVGPSGSDYSRNGGESWMSIGKEGYNSIAFANSARAGWAAGPKGRIAKYIMKLQVPSSSR
jgi:photosystem II stability/assembly factor-like uncharacterized protein